MLPCGIQTQVLHTYISRQHSACTVLHQDRLSSSPSLRSTWTFSNYRVLSEVSYCPDAYRMNHWKHKPWLFTAQIQSSGTDKASQSVLGPHISAVLQLSNRVLRRSTRAFSKLYFMAFRRLLLNEPEVRKQDPCSFLQRWLSNTQQHSPGYPASSSLVQIQPHKKQINGTTLKYTKFNWLRVSSIQ